MPFSFSDLSGQKVRPVLLLAAAGRGDWIVCQITSNPYAELNPVALTAASFADGGLSRDSYARPLKLSTLNERIFISVVGTLQPATFELVRRAVIEALSH